MVGIFSDEMDDLLLILAQRRHPNAIDWTDWEHPYDNYTAWEQKTIPNWTCLICDCDFDYYNVDVLQHGSEHLKEKGLLILI